MVEVAEFEILRYRCSELDVAAIHDCASVQVVIAHPLRNVLHVRLVRLEGSFHHSSLVQKVHKAIHMERVQKIDLEEEPPSYVIPIEWNTLHQGDMRHKSGLPVVCIPTEADSQSIVDREMKTSDCGVYYNLCELSDQSRCGYTVRTFFWRQ